jgi:hypothetical protein
VLLNLLNVDWLVAEGTFGNVLDAEIVVQLEFGLLDLFGT